MSTRESMAEWTARDCTYEYLIGLNIYLKVFLSLAWDLGPGSPRSQDFPLVIPVRPHAGLSSRPQAFAPMGCCPVVPRPGVGVCLHSMPSCLYADPLIGHPSQTPSSDATGNESSSQTHLLTGNLYLALAIEILAVYGPLILGPSNLVTCYYIAIFYLL
jgi:hypothetical protein